MVGVISIVNYSLDTFYDPRVIPAYGLGLDLTLILNTCLVPVMFYVVITQSKAVGSYKWYILNGIFCDYAYDLLVSSWQPVPLFPCYMAYANGPFKNFIGQELSYIGLAVGVLIYVNMASNQLLAFLTRFSQVSPLKWAGYFKVGKFLLH
uniref:Uncharacterized protein n=1 Tax=Acrobeloides nanus TaxID=290746 RepID=A0A914EID0_9BILA